MGRELDRNGLNIITGTLDRYLDGTHQVRASQIKHLDRYILGLIYPCDKNRKSVTALSEESAVPCNQSSLNRFLNKGRRLAQSLNNNRINQLVQPGKPRYIIIDDTVLEHPYGPCIQGTGKYWDNSEKRWTLGHNIVTSLVANADDFEPLDIFFYLKEKYAEENNTVFKTKIQIARDIIRARAKQLNARGVVFDSWFCCEDIMSECEKQGLKWYSELRENRNVYLSETSGKIHVSDLAKAISPSEFKLVNLPESWSRYSRMVETIVIIKGKRTKARTIKLVILWDGKDDSESFKFLATNDLTISGVEVVEIYRLRWYIEEFHRDAKQNLGLADCMLRKYDGVLTHVLLVRLAYSALKRLLASKLKNVVSTIGECCRYLKKQFLRLHYSTQTAVS
jgi:SRSO17 transposase